MRQWFHRHGWNEKTYRPGMPSVCFVSESSFFIRRKIRQETPHWILDYAFNDAGLYSIGDDDAWHRRLPHTAHLYAPGCVRWEDTRILRRSLRTLFIILLGGDHTSLLYFTGKGGCARFIDNHGQLGLLLNQIARIGNEFGHAGFWEAQSCFCRIVSLLHRGELVDMNTWQIPSSRKPTAEPSALVASARAYFRLHMAESVAVEDVARYLGMSVSAFGHRYRRDAGESPMCALIRFRIDRVKRMLTRGHPLKTIAETVGMCDEFHLSKAFKRVVGMTPSEFRALKHVALAP
ncbi:MAG: helix-turn-helix transcriptional regulator [Lentisphaerae bacterium]|nr:helix-turn-helix transcriptional regulator [Lentisphaerota bacterium]